MRTRSMRSQFLIAVGLLALGGCSASDPPSRLIGSGGTGPSGGNGGSGGTGTLPPRDAGGGADGHGLPCEIRTIIDARCGTCHTSPPSFGAPVPLVTWDDFQTQSVKEPARKVYQVVDDRIHRTGAGRMPENGSLSASELAALESWLAQGTPAGDNCGTGTPPTRDGGGPRYDAGLPDAPTDDGTECVEFRAHGQQGVAGDQTPFDTSTIVLPPNEFYACFNFASPWTKPMQGLQFASMIDNVKTVHHWLFYESSIGTLDGTFSPCSGQHPGQALITGWAPGNEALQLPSDVGLELAPPTGSYVLEVHYNNPEGQVFQDRSGVRVCATPSFRPKTASITWAGTEKISVPPRATGTASGKCVPGRIGMGTNDPIQIFAAWPHMHKTGTRMVTVINRASGTQDLLLDKPFTFSSQVNYDVRATINPGDTLFTTCYYENPTAGAISFGPSTDQEMCYDFLYAYPAHGLDHPPGGIVTSGAANLCTDN